MAWFIANHAFFLFNFVVMKILQISSAKTFGGGEKHFVDLCKGLHERGHEVFVVVRPTSDWKERLNFLPEKNIFKVSIRNSFGIFSSQRIAKLIRKNEIEIVHAHVARDYIPASLACRISKGPKLVITRHVLFSMKAFYRFALNNLGKAIAVSEGVKANLMATFSPNKIVTIPNGVDKEEFSAAERNSLREVFRSENEIPFDALFIGTVGELKELKGQRDFVLAAKIVAEKYPAARFAIIGTDNSANQSFRRELKRLVKIFGLEENFLWLNWVEDTAAFLCAVDIFVSPSHSESFGLATLEAMANETPIVATETVGSDEMLRNGETGLIVPIKDPVKLSEAIGKLAADPETRITLAKEARKHAAKTYSLEKMITKTENLYSGLLDD